MTDCGSAAPIKTFIFGSCVSRDTFEFLGSDFALVRYVARQSSISAGTDARKVAPRLGPIASTFQERMVRGDLAGDLPVALAASAHGIDLLLIDLVDERGGVIDVGGGYLTKLAEFWSAGGREATRGMAHVVFGTDEHFGLWRAGVSRLKKQLEELGLLHKTLVLRTPWASSFDDGETLTIPDWMMAPEQADRLYERYFDFLSDGGFRVVELPAGLARTPRQHQWGPSPFHYIRQAYEFLATEIRDAAIGRERAPVLSRRDTSAWGVFAEYTDPSEIERDGGEIPTLLTVWQAGYPLDVMVEDNGASTTLVSFHAALGDSGLRPPIFTGRAISVGQAVNRIFVSDPGLLAAKGLGLAWYLGTSELDLTSLLADVIRVLQHRMGAQHLVFFGMSGGGFAALNLAHEFPSSLAVPVNPQTRVLDYAQVHWEAMARACLGATTAESARGVLEAHPRADQRRVYSDGFDNSVIYVQNSADAHVSIQMLPWLEAVRWSERAPVLMRDWGQGHKPPPPAVLRTMLSEVAGVDGDWAALGARWGAQLRPTREWVRSVSGR